MWALDRRLIVSIQVVVDPDCFFNSGCSGIRGSECERGLWALDRRLMVSIQVVVVVLVVVGGGVVVVGVVVAVVVVIDALPAQDWAFSP